MNNEQHNPQNRRHKACRMPGSRQRQRCHCPGNHRRLQIRLLKRHRHRNHSTRTVGRCRKAGFRKRKKEPQWLLDFRLEAFRYWKTLTPPTWAHLDIPTIDFQAISYYAAPVKKEGPRSLDEVDPKNPRHLQPSGHTHRRAESAVGHGRRRCDGFRFRAHHTPRAPCRNGHNILPRSAKLSATIPTSSANTSARSSATATTSMPH